MSLYIKLLVLLLVATVSVTLFAATYFSNLNIAFTLNPIISTHGQLKQAKLPEILEDYETNVNISYNNKKVILAWTKFFGWTFNDKEYMSVCPEYNCTITNNKSILSQAHAVVFHARNFDWKQVPTNRESWQRFVFLLMESPHHTGIRNLNEIPGFFNWTMTYRYDSDVHLPYGYLDFFQNVTDADCGPYNKKDGNLLYNLENLRKIVLGKTEPVVWFVSNCKTPSKRDHYANKLKQYINIDIYGGCGMRNCSKDKMQDCNQMIEDKYFFYYAAENSICRDYITEKIWSRLSKWSVPIVLRRSLYESHLPMSSFIALDDYSSAKVMALHLNRLMSNREQYLKYFEWRRCQNDKNNAIIENAFQKDKKKSFCKLCQMLQDPSLPHKTYSDLAWWWRTQAACISGQVIW